MRKFPFGAIVLAAWLCLAPGLADAQTPTFSTMVNVSGTIAVSNTFQSIIVPNRKACTIENNGASNQWVFFGPIASATKATAVVLTPGMSVTCGAVNGPTFQDQVSITGTAADTFFAGYSAWQ